MYPGACFGRRYFIQAFHFVAFHESKQRSPTARGGRRWLLARARGCVCRVSVTSRQRTPAGVRCVLSIRVIRENRHYRGDNERNGTQDDFSSASMNRRIGEKGARRTRE